MPTLDAPQARHYGRAERTIGLPEGMAGPDEIVIGVVYDPAKVPPSKLEDMFDERLTETWDEATRQRRLTLNGGGASWDPWEAVARLEASHPGDILPHPWLKLPRRLAYPRWYPTAEEVERIERTRVSKEKGRYIHETGDWAVDGEGA